MADDVFDAGWLSLREPVDHRSRDPELVRELDHEGGNRGWTRVLDLGSGTGSNLRYLRPRLGWGHRWTLLDHDPRLLLQAEAPDSACTVVRVTGDLAVEGLDRVTESDLVTASALLDLVSESWLQALVDRCVDAGAGALFTLSYDGSVEWGVPDPVDVAVREAVNAHQEREKGLGAALGPRAAPVAEGRFSAAGWRTRLRPSPWELSGPGDAELAMALVRGWVDAACEMAPDGASEFRSWEERRLAQLAAGRVHLRVGHLDLLALPPGP